LILTGNFARFFNTFGVAYTNAHIWTFHSLWTFSNPIYFAWTFNSLWTFSSMDILPYGHFTLWTICRFTNGGTSATPYSAFK
jgi:hypothetical protein